MSSAALASANARVVSAAMRRRARLPGESPVASLKEFPTIHMSPGADFREAPRVVKAEVFVDCDTAELGEKQVSEPPNLGGPRMTVWDLGKDAGQWRAPELREEELILFFRGASNGVAVGEDCEALENRIVGVRKDECAACAIRVFPKAGFT